MQKGVDSRCQAAIITFGVSVVSVRPIILMTRLVFAADAVRKQGASFVLYAEHIPVSKESGCVLIV